jgi:hypothetical protein
MKDKLFTRQEVEELMEISVETTDEEVGRSQNFRYTGDAYFGASGIELKNKFIQDEIEYLIKRRKTN